MITFSLGTEVSNDAIARLEQVFDVALSGQYQRSQDQSKTYGTR